MRYFAIYTDDRRCDCIFSFFFLQKNYFQVHFLTIDKNSSLQISQFLNWINASFKILNPNPLNRRKLSFFKNSFRNKLLSLLLFFFFFISIHKIPHVNFSHFTKTVFPCFSISYPICYRNSCFSSLYNLHIFTIKIETGLFQLYPNFLLFLEFLERSIRFLQEIR